MTLTGHQDENPRENRLSGETSPYLLQHKDNPVDWRPWETAAFDEARREDKPVLLSIGYAACHWCHVMAHECFENPEIADLMNRNFVNIKVDREERPDLDSIYQNALALLGEHGGWPLTMFLTPAGEPFWGGTYFPPEPRYGRPSLPQVLEGISDAYRSSPEKVEQNVTAIRDALQKLSTNARGESLSVEMIDEVAQHLLGAFDPVEGGIGQAPKFPNAPILKLLWRVWHRRKDEPCRRAVTLTLTKMSQGGLYDHLGGGYARYAVDHRWLVPHFEKMLYDNAQLIELLAWAWAHTGDHLYRKRLHETVEWVLREMRAGRTAEATSISGERVPAFAASLDADSEGEEGRFYVWQEAEIDSLLSREEATLFKQVYDVSPQGNWEGKTILNRMASPELLDDASEERLAHQRDILFSERTRRVWPGWDDKVLADWNALMISALAEAGAVTGESSWIEAASDAFDFIMDTFEQDGRLAHSWRHGTLRHAGMLDDYASMATAALTLYEITSDPRRLEEARRLVAAADEHFWDDANAGYFLTADDAESLVVRSKTVYDSAVPSGNGMMLGALARLAALTGDRHFRDRAHTLASAFAGEVNRNVVPLATYLGHVELLEKGVQVVILGERGEPRCEALVRAVFEAAAPNRILQVIPAASDLPEEHPAAGKAERSGDGPVAYVCHGQSCSLPITEPRELAASLA